MLINDISLLYRNEKNPNSCLQQLGLFSLSIETKLHNYFIIKLLVCVKVKSSMCLRSNSFKGSTTNFLFQQVLHLKI